MTTALVLGAGGPTGAAWELGILAGLLDSGVDVTDADTIIGTSGGSVVAVLLSSGVPIRTLYEQQLTQARHEVHATMGLRFAMMTAAAMLRSPDPRRFRQRVGAKARSAKTIPEAARRVVIEHRLPHHQWPQRLVRLVAVDTASGETAVFDRDSGVSLVDAVAASCAVPTIWPTATIDGRRYMDGGLRSWTNADLAEGAERIVVLAPMRQGAGPMPPVADQVKALARRATVALITPDESSIAAIGGNILDPRRRRQCAEAGRRQAAEVATAVQSAWIGESGSASRG